MNSNLAHGDNFLADLLSSTEWAAFSNPIIDPLIHNFFSYLFLGNNWLIGPCQWCHHGKTHLTRIRIQTLGKPCQDTLVNLDDILTFMEGIKTPDNIKKYFDPSWDENKSLPLATFNGPFCAMTIVQSDNYPVAARTIKDLFPTYSTGHHKPRGFPLWKCHAPAARQDW